jgi:hypothetical protein
MTTLSELLVADDIIHFKWKGIMMERGGKAGSRDVR